MRRSSRLRRHSTILALAAVVLGAQAAAVHAQSTLCADLRDSLATLDNGRAGADPGPYDRAIDTQQDELGKARAAARGARCGFAVESADIDRCASINAAISRMVDNLFDLRQRRGGVAAPGEPERARMRILAELDANGCGAGRGEPREAGRRLPRAIDGRTGLEMAPEYGDGGLGPPPGEQRMDDRRITPEQGNDGILRIPEPGYGDDILRIPDRRATFERGSYRTLCVRMCDGYYFPISYAVPPAAFGGDAQTCQARCPGAQVELYAHRVPGEDTNDMRSVASGEPYSRLPTAFRYRQTDRRKPSSCGCGTPMDFSVLGGDSEPDRGFFEEPEIPEGAERGAVSPPLPLSRPDPGADPETIANRRARLDAEAVKRLLSSKTETTRGEGGRIRVVGPEFYPDPEEAEEPQARDRTRDR